jgi:hypothetical protein
MLNFPEPMKTRFLVSNLPRPRLGIPTSLLFIPKFSILLKNGSRTKAATVGFDTGLQDAHLQVPSTVADELGIVSVGAENRSDATQNFVVNRGIIDEISVPGVSNCSLRNAKVLFFDDAPFLIGNDFLRDLGGDISYAKGTSDLTCDGPNINQQPRSVPIFSVTLVQGGQAQTVSAFFDTGWEGTDIAVPAGLAQQLGLPALKTITARTHTGTVNLVKSKLDRLSLADVPQCYVDGADVDILPANSPVQRVIVGEGFFKRIDGRIGYDQKGALFSCGGSGAQVARSTGTGIIPPEAYPIERPLDLDPWLIGGAAVLGAGLLASLYLALSD